MVLSQGILLRPPTFNLKSGVLASATWPRQRHDMRSMYIVALMTSGKRSWPQERLVLKLSNVDFGRIWGGRERDSENAAHVGRITKIVDCIRIVFGLPYNYKPNLSLKMI